MLSALQSRDLGVRASPRPFREHASTSYDLLERLEAQVLDGHRGCVNTVSFTPDGETLVSGSDDQTIVLWNWEQGKCANARGRRVYCAKTTLAEGAQARSRCKPYCDCVDCRNVSSML